MTKFMSAEKALSISKNNKQERVEYYLKNIDKDRKANIIKGKIEKAVARGETYVYVAFLFNTNQERTIAIEKYFSDLGYDISLDDNVCEISLDGDEDLSYPF
ncbi:hypothetical protein 8014-B2_0055 [Lactobacillus phage ATCC 8014-B2]|uniref:Uncharacterized protein n=1 Tax=Lactobacillus phage ATCC 8014-B2 TaxID=1225795 RepID=K4I1Z8_9CAUD|nr:hypothetical protein HOQ89_gp091 [Lactobacillus phage ATCC 8014-B2]AFU63122.1 hypothetical protein 8014-B2_0055 [Lactobacillus phage ATCC 8014-B2]